MEAKNLNSGLSISSMFSIIALGWKACLKIGYHKSEPGLMRGKIMLLNGMVIITSLTVISFSIVYFIIDYRYYYSALYFLPLAIWILTLNHKGKFGMAQCVYLFGSLLVISYWCYEGRRNGNEFTLIALATTTTLIFERRYMIVISNFLCALVFVLYKIYDLSIPFVADPVINYEVVPVVILLTSVAVVSFQIVFFRDLAKHYKETDRAEHRTC